MGMAWLCLALPVGQPSECHLVACRSPALLLAQMVPVWAPAPAQDPPLRPACQAAFRNYSGLQFGWVAAGL